MLEFTRKKAYFIGIDSDGTVFDSMTLKHTHAFIPAMIHVWEFTAFSDAVYRIAEHINLYSNTRGINRFPGLLLTFEELKKELGDSFPIKDYRDLQLFVKSDAPMSGAGLKQYLAEHPSAFLNEVLRWSEMGDRLFLEACKTLLPFQMVKPTLEKMQEACPLTERFGSIIEPKLSGTTILLGDATITCPEGWECRISTQEHAISSHAINDSETVYIMDFIPRNEGEKTFTLTISL